MPGVTPRGEMNGYGDFASGHLRTSSYQTNGYDPYKRDDYHRDDREPPYGRVIRNGGAGPDRFNADFLDQSSLDGRFDMKDEISFEVDHLATYTAKSGVMDTDDGLKKLRQMENTTGIWTMRCMMVLDRRHLLIIDKANGEELERFTLEQIHRPTAVLKNDRREIYNNLVLFTAVELPGSAKQTEMHIFQSVTTASQDIVDEIHASQEGRGKGVYQGHRIPPPPPQPAPEPPREPVQYNYNHFRSEERNIRESTRPPPPVDYRVSRREPEPGPSSGAMVAGGAMAGGGGMMGYRASYRHQEDVDTGQNEALERDVQLLNNCFDDIEKFVARLQHAAEAYKELDKRKKDRGKHKRDSADRERLIEMARPPPGDDFVDIFQKFKYAFNLLAKLKAHIHDPNAPELVHFLFTPLSLIYEASRDPFHQGVDLSDKAVSPILTADAKQLLLNCLTSKELELWQALGNHWTKSREDFKGYVAPFTPRFYNGWQPSPHHDDVPVFSTPVIMNNREEPRMIEDRARNTVVPFPPQEDRYVRDYDHSEQDYRRTERPSPVPTPPSGAMGPPPAVSGYPESKPSHKPMPPRTKPREEENMQWASELKRMRAKTFEAIHERVGRNAKELTLEKGDIVQVLDDTRNWWKLKNYKGETGYAPYTILKEYTVSDDERFEERPLSGNYNNYIGNTEPPPAPAVPSSTDSSARRGRRGEFRYF